VNNLNVYICRNVWPRPEWDNWTARVSGPVELSFTVEDALWSVWSWSIRNHWCWGAKHRSLSCWLSLSFALQIFVCVTSIFTVWIHQTDVHGQQSLFNILSLFSLKQHSENGDMWSELQAEFYSWLFLNISVFIRITIMVMMMHL